MLVLSEITPPGIGDRPHLELRFGYAEVSDDSSSVIFTRTHEKDVSQDFSEVAHARAAFVERATRSYRSSSSLIAPLGRELVQELKVLGQSARTLQGPRLARASPVWTSRRGRRYRPNSGETTLYESKLALSFLTAKRSASLAWPSSNCDM